MWQVPATVAGPKLCFPAAWLFNDSPSLAGQWEAPPVTSLSVSHILGNVCTTPFCTFQDEEGLNFFSSFCPSWRSKPPFLCPLGQLLLQGHPLLPCLLSFVPLGSLPRSFLANRLSVSLSRAIKQNPSFCYPALLCGGCGVEGGGSSLCYGL